LFYDERLYTCFVFLPSKCYSHDEVENNQKIKINNDYCATLQTGENATGISFI